MSFQSGFGNRIALIVLVASLGCFTGCQNWVNRGLIAPPGPMNYQQANAVIHDPFPQSDIGVPDLAARPPGYENPLSLPVRNRTVDDMMPWLKQPAGTPGF